MRNAAQWLALHCWKMWQMGGRQQDDLLVNEEQWTQSRFRLPRAVLLGLCAVLGPALQRGALRETTPCLSHFKRAQLQRPVSETLSLYAFFQVWNQTKPNPTKPNQTKPNQHSDQWFGPEQSNYRCERALSLLETSWTQKCCFLWTFMIEISSTALVDEN